MFELNDFEAIGIKLASPERILEWSRGEVKKPETINYRTLKPEKDGLFCEKIFGPTKDWECYCGKYKKIRYKGIVCDRCGVEVTKSKVRRERLGHIKLAAPVSHIWYFRGIPSRMGLLLDMSPRVLERVLYFASYIVIDPMDTDLTYKQVLSEYEYREAIETYGRKSFVAKMGAEAIKIILQNINIDEMARDLREDFRSSAGQKRIRIIKRLEVVESFKKSGNKPEWMILDVIPVLPPELRPMVQLDGGRFATSDLNDLYRRVINRNSRLLKLLALSAPEIIIRNEKRMLQEAVDALIDNGRRGRAVTGPGNRPLKSLSDMLKGKQGRFRQNLLGKRVDYSGRSVIVVGPELEMHQCGLPKEMALELFKPFVFKRLVKDGKAHNIKTAKKLVDRAKDDVWDILEDVIKDHPVLLNRAPTLHRMGIQAFEPVLVEGRAIKLHPLVCTAYNADFDGDQMAVHLPLSAEAQAEARFLMLSSNNLLKPQDGKPVTVPTQDMVLGCYYMTIVKEGAKGEGKVFTSIDEAVMAWDAGQLDLHAKIRIRIKKEIADDAGVKKTVSGLVDGTLGRFLFNEIIPQNLGIVDRTKKENLIKLECDFLVSKSKLAMIIEKSIKTQGISKTAFILDKIKEIGFKFATKGGISLSIYDMIVPDIKEEKLKKAEEEIEKVTRGFERGSLSEEDRYKTVVKIWRETTDSITESLVESLEPLNPLNMMSKSSARGNINQIKQLAGMRGNMFDTSGQIIEIPIKSNLREGMNVWEFFISSHGARKSLTDTALKTADSGYLTRRLVDVSQDVIVREYDCGTDEGVYVKGLYAGSDSQKRIVKNLSDRIIGRYAAEDLLHPITKEIIVKKDQLINDDIAAAIEKIDSIKEVKIRSVLTCRARHGVCVKCYGTNLAVNEPVSIGEAVGIMAAQSIGEPGTQLTMRTFHTGGIAGEDITQGLPRVEELFEARKPKGQAVLTEVAGTVSIDVSSKRRRDITVTPPENSEDLPKTYPVPYGSQLNVSEGDVVQIGDLLTDGSVNPHDIMKLKGPEEGVREVQNYIIDEVIKVYKNNGVDINDKHIEVIVRQMLRKYRVDDPGDTDLMTGTLVDMFDFEDANKKAEEEGVNPAIGKVALLGITKASLATDSFLSAASFQETTRVLTDAAVKGKIDPLLGLKENVIIGKLITAGTGMNRYRNITAVPEVPENSAFLEEHKDLVLN